MKNWKNDHIFRILSDPNSTEDQWLSAIDELSQVKRTKGSDLWKARWHVCRLGLLGLVCGAAIEFLSFITLISHGYGSHLVYSSMVLAAVLACCQPKNKVFKLGLNAGMLLSILVWPSMSSGWSSEYRIWQAAAIILSLCVYAAWTLMLYLWTGHNGRLHQTPPKNENTCGTPEAITSSPAVVSCNPAPPPKLPINKHQNILEGYSGSVIPLRKSGAPHLVAFEKLKEKPTSSPGKIIQLKQVSNETQCSREEKKIEPGSEQ